jgi:hypothetical protein
LLSTSQSAKEATINSAIGYLERSMNDAKTLNFAGGDFTLPPTDLARYFNFKLTGTGAASNLNITATKRMFALDNIAGGDDVTLNCTSDTLVIPAGAIVLVLCDGTNLISVADSTVTGGGGGGSTNLLGLTDTPNSYSGQSGLVLRVKIDESGIEFYALKLTDLSDVNEAGIADGDVLVWDTTTSKFIPAAFPSTGGADDAGIVARAATTADISIDDILVIGGVLDNVTLALNDVALVKNNSTDTENGLYTVTAGAPVRSSIMAAHASVAQGLTILVREGDVNGGTEWFQTEALAAAEDTPLNFQIVGTRIEATTDFDDTVTLVNGMVMVYNLATKKWKPQVTSTTLPTGGTAGQALVKVSSTDYDFTFRTLVPSGGAAGQGLVKNSGTDWDSTWATVVTVGGRTVTGTSDTPVLTDANHTIVGNNAANITFTIPPNSSVAYPLWTTLTFNQRGAGQCVIAAGGGVTINKPATFLAQSAEQHATIAVQKIGTDEWTLTGYLEAA